MLGTHEAKTSPEPRSTAGLPPVESPVVVSAHGRRFGLRVEERNHLARRLDRLTPREREVAYAVFIGGDNEALASRLCIAMPTLRTHLMRINQKLGTTSKTDIVQYVALSLLDGYREGTIKPESS